MKNIKKILNSSNLKTTPQRLAILQAIENQGHASIEDIYEKIKENFPRMSLATIYKNIATLKKEGIITEVCLNQKIKYELAKNEHAHFICKICEKIFDIPLNDKILKDIETMYPYTQKMIYLYGICDKCKHDINQQC